MTISIAFLAASCCPAPKHVYCHGWTAAEKTRLKVEAAEIAPDTPLDAQFRDYERVCSELER